MFPFFFLKKDPSSRALALNDVFRVRGVGAHKGFTSKFTITPLTVKARNDATYFTPTLEETPNPRRRRNRLGRVGRD